MKENTTYRIIADYKALDEFLEWLPSLEINECFYVALFARKKYHHSAQNDKCNCTRFVATTKEWLFRKLKGLERPYGSYANANGTFMEQEALAVYINVNPRNMYRAQNSLLKRLADTITAKHVHMNPASMALSEVQKSCGTKYYIDFDFDGVEFDYIQPELDNIIPNAYTLIHTRGGFHVLVNKECVRPNMKKSWYNLVKGLYGCDVSGDSIVPIPGCVQGDFVPKLEVF